MGGFSWPAFFRFTTTMLARSPMLLPKALSVDPAGAITVILTRPLTGLGSPISRPIVFNGTGSVTNLPGTISSNDVHVRTTDRRRRRQLHHMSFAHEP